MSMKTVLLAFCLIWMTKAQQDCITITAQRPCVFPFTYKGVSYDGCTYAGNSPTAWCALDNSGTKWDDCQDNCPIASSNNGNVNSEVKAWGNWGQCSGGCGVGNGVEERRRGEEVETRSCTTLDRCIGNNNGGNNINNGNNGNNANTNKDCYTTGGPQRNQLCVFPFKHGALEYHDCTRAGHKQKKLWCSTKVDSTGRHIDGQGLFGTCSGFCFTNANNGGGGGGSSPQGVWNNWSNWGQCSGGNGGDNGVSERRRACQGANCQGNKVETRACSNSGGSGASGRCITNGGPAAGQACVFPFKYARRTHSGCGVWRWGGPNQGKKWCSTRTSRNGNHISKSGNYGLCPNTPQCNGGGNGNGGGNVNFGNGNGGGNGNFGNGNGGGNGNSGNNGGNGNFGNGGNGNGGGNGGSVDTSDRGTVANSDPQIDVSDRSANQEANVGAPQ